MSTYRIQVVQEFFVDAENKVEAEKFASEFMDTIQGADELVPNNYLWEFSDWNISEVNELVYPRP